MLKGRTLRKMSRILFFWQNKKKHKSKAFSKFTNASMALKLARLLTILFLVIFIHTLAIYYFEGLSFIDSAWLSVTSITTVGYGDFSASTLEGRIATIVLIYIIGIWLLAQLAGDFLDFRADKRERMIRGLWRWKEMKEHILIINTPSTGGDRYLIRLIEQIKKTPEIDSLPIEIATTAYPNGLPHDLRSMDVVHYHIDISSTIELEDLNIKSAKYVLILCQDEADVRSDSLTLDILDRIKQFDSNSFILAECILDENRDRFQRLGANAVIRPVRGYPELIVRALSAPGTERVLENLFTHDGASARRYDIQLTGMTWKDIACMLISAGAGTPLGFISNCGNVITNPHYEDEINAIALLIMVNDAADISNEAVQKILAR